MRTPISVALATRNGSAYLTAQVASILAQLREGDELIISVDPSNDGTRELADHLAANAPAVHVIDGPGQGVAKNFERALDATRNPHLFLSDHDDVWMPGKVDEAQKTFAQSGALLIVHDAQLVDQDLRVIAPSYFRQRGSGPGFLKNLLKNSYVGACMAFTSNLKDLALPFPSNIPMHDQWLGLLAERYGDVYFLDKPLVRYRRHKGNATSDTHASLGQMFIWRKDLIQALYQHERKLDGQIQLHPNGHTRRADD
ncbi:MAG: glycosyltransferase family 2 protein [Coriobacteriales bacterium]|jgi:glycosyltransferase involved in cell wall biosynthesis|nr:glycosyltransferase family 2 protein [Coriobacteriales bacterium]